MKVSSVAVLVGALAACANENGGAFVTTTKIAIDGDFTEQAVSVGYDRFEGFVGPAYETGAVPPVVARIDADTSLLTPHVRQFYATGNAAIYATCPTPVTRVPASAANDAAADPCTARPSPALTGDRRIMYFGTGSVIGLKVGFAGQQPDSITLGYKRKEFSWLPILKPRNAEDPHAYGSVLAAFNLDSEVETLGATGVQIGQFFATGAAAESIANQEEVKEEVQARFLALARAALEPGGGDAAGGDGGVPGAPALGP